MTKIIYVIHGPNLNLLGVREPEIYGSTTLDEINELITQYAAGKKLVTKIMQSNDEGEIISQIQEAILNANGLIINPGAYTHTSIAIRDALSALNKPAVEVHLSNIYAREVFRQHSHVSPVVTGVISGFGKQGYMLALDYLSQVIL